MYPGTHARSTPDKVAHVMTGSGEQVTYRELDERSNRLAQLMWAAGLRPGDHLAALLENNVRYPEVYWAAIRSGLYVTTVNRYLTGEEAAFIVEDCEARVLVTSAALAEVAVDVARRVPGCPVRLMVDGVAEGYEPYEEAIAGHPAEPLAEEPMGETMLYSSGTTGRPKGIKRPLSGRRADAGAGISPILGPLFEMDADIVYLSPAPMYHSAPLGFSMGAQTLGGTVVIMERFDPEEALAAIERHRVTHSQWVPTMFSRMLKLPEEARTRHDLSSQRVAIHAAAPCPVGVKEQMIEWWGPILYEYYGGTEVNGLTYIRSEEWLEHRGSVGKPVLGTLHICDESGAELPPREPGIVYFELPKRPFEYHGDPEKTRKAEHPDHPNWTALGDVGYVDEDGYLYLTDRATFMIISGGVNIYPQEIENVLVLHPKVADVAVFGVPDPDFGEQVKAVVQPLEPGTAGPVLEQELLAYCREHLAGYKVPRSMDFEDELPRLPTGKLYKRLLRDRYWGKTESRIV
ncbi:MAG: AMP-binding protein [Acidimicrobiales bacterium]|nr:AMP-binding protein [Acidimicrobiales bacterium]